MRGSRRCSSRSSIGWAESITEFDGRVGCVHVSGARMMQDDDELPTWGYVDPEDLGLSASARYDGTPGASTVDARTTTGGAAASSTTTGADAASTATTAPTPPAGAQVARGQWIGALQMMQEYEDEARHLSKARSGRDRRGRGTGSGGGRTRSNPTSSNPEGYVDDELREACKMALMSASVRGSRRRRVWM